MQLEGYNLIDIKNTLPMEQSHPTKTIFDQLASARQAQPARSHQRKIETIHQVAGPIESVSR